jgi:sugar lactone lactonase YvrE
MAGGGRRQFRLECPLGREDHRYDRRARWKKSIPVQRHSCAFGGPALDELYITSARVGLDELALREQPWAGDLFRLKTEVKGMPAPQFSG